MRLLHKNMLSKPVARKQLSRKQCHDIVSIPCCYFVWAMCGHNSHNTVQGEQTTSTIKMAICEERALRMKTALVTPAHVSYSSALSSNGPASTAHLGKAPWIDMNSESQKHSIGFDMSPVCTERSYLHTDTRSWASFPGSAA